MATVTSDPSRMRPEDYREAAALRLAEARRFETARAHPGLRLYLAGVAVECALRSRLDAAHPFDGRHDLRRLARETGFLEVGPQAAKNRTVWLTTIVRLWRNSYRYMSDDKISRVLHGARQYEKQPDRSKLAQLAATDALLAAGRLWSACLAHTQTDHQGGPA